MNLTRDNTMKTCTACKEDKPLTEFWPDRRPHGGLLARCKTCRIDDRRSWRHKRTRKAWDAEELAHARALHDHGFGYPQIAERLGRSVGAIVTALQKNLVHPHCYASRLGRGAAVFLKPDDRLLAARDARAVALDARTITATLMGDPPPGYSALDDQGKSR